MNLGVDCGFSFYTEKLLLEDDMGVGFLSGTWPVGLNTSGKTENMLSSKYLGGDKGKEVSRLPNQTGILVNGYKLYISV